MKPPPLKLRRNRLRLGHDGSQRRGNSRMPDEAVDGPLTSSEWTQVAKALLLAPRELALVRCLCRGQNDTAIAEVLGVTPRRVQTFLSRLYRKLGVHSRAGTLLRIFAEYIHIAEGQLIRSDRPPSPSDPNQPA
jgi:DNA-binding CsgD family transcriptional regulator